MARIPKHIKSWERFINVPELIHPDFADHNVRAMFKKARLEAQVSISKVARKLGTGDGHIWEYENGIKPIPEFLAVHWARVLLIRFKDLREAYIKDVSARLNLAEKNGVDRWRRSQKQIASDSEASSPQSNPDTESLPNHADQTSRQD